MKTRKIIATIFIIIAIVLGVIFYTKIDFPIGLEPYFKKAFYGQFGPFAICIELLIAGIYLFNKHPKSNFALALFGFTALLDPIFNTIGLFTSIVPTYAMVLFAICSLIALWLAFSNTFKLGRISLIGVTASFILGIAVELFFNYL
ncbi:hypothetical protein JQC67_12365 [Aurantibacter crassamenti]|uniref:hypothetical protein n=1 Tax=Aurantibacter crassamenti TaxID=1837375 RepID=UPI00193A9217|nr:hypothetical protein [Aurantibacter crassamenti]MBM1106936.1 hypothetical protein [Aurantibacter crassamenti]